MAKRGISVVRSYQGSGLFTILGLGADITQLLFSKHPSLIGGIGFDDVRKKILQRAASVDGELENKFLYKEHAAQSLGERHSLTSVRSREIHKILSLEYGSSVALSAWEKLRNDLNQSHINLRDYFQLIKNPINLDKVEKIESILPRFGTGAMSFGAISAESQRDLILAMAEIGGRSNSGEGGENPYYYDQGISASIKQIASGRFGVTAEYLYTGQEVQIKIAQGAKPGEGGQLMGIKVNDDIARARHARVGVSLISPPPHHDIYSIEDLKQLIYEIKAFKPELKVSVKLVAGDNIGAIALGVVKAGADIIHISGGSGGTGAAALTSMKHAGLPWELGLSEVHESLARAGVREQVLLRVDGGLFTGRDIVCAAFLGADHFEFGKILLVAEGCIMARVCEKNTCPAGIATQDPKFKARYKGKVDHVVKFLKYLAEDVRYELAKLGQESLEKVIGNRKLISGIEAGKKLVYTSLLQNHFPYSGNLPQKQEPLNDLNLEVLKNYQKADYFYHIKSTDRAIPARLSGHLTQMKIEQTKTSSANYQLNFIGSAGQGFGFMNTTGMHLKLFGEANDSVGKGMDDGEIVIVAHKDCKIDPNQSVLLGNACLYGATGGVMIIDGLVGDRFAIRNSGAEAIVRGAGFNACEYMTGGKVIILGRVLSNIGAGMTGGVLYISKEYQKSVNMEFLKAHELTKEDRNFFQEMIEKLNQHTATAINVSLDDYICLSP